MALKKNYLALAAFFMMAFAASAQAPKYSNEFLSIGVGARALGMSGSTIATVNDVTSSYWNPAGLNYLNSNHQVALMHSEYFAGIAKYDYGAYAHKLDSSSVFGATIIRFAVDDIPNTTDLIDADGNIDYNRITTFSAADYGFIFSYARSSKIPGLKLGANAKIIYRKIGDFANAIGFGLDAGVQYAFKSWKFGAMGRDITTTFNAWRTDLDDRTKEVFLQTGNELPGNSVEITLPRLVLGAGRNFNLTSKIGLLAEVDLDLTTDRKRNVLIKGNPFSIDPHLGIELKYTDLIFVRAGIGNIQQVTDNNDQKTTTFQPNIGVGVKIKGITIDYALTDVSDQSIALQSNVFSLKFDFNRFLSN